MEGGEPHTRYHDLTFGGDFLTALRDDGRTVRFSRLERALLSTFSARPKRLFSREQLLSVMRAEPEELNDRSVDFVINRLRKKLGDSARRPKFIATQYGEGYVWIAAGETFADTSGFMVIAPLRLPADPASAEKAEAMLRRLRAALAGVLEPRRRVVLDETWRPGPQQSYRFSLQANFVAGNVSGETDVGLVLRDELTRQVLAVERLRLTDDPGDQAARRLARRLLSQMWRRLALAPGAALLPTDEPLHLRMHEAAMLLAPGLETWREMERRFADREAGPSEDPQARIMRAVIAHARLLFGAAGDPADPETYRRGSKVIAPLVLGALPDVRADPVLSLAAAKLLLQIGREHEALAERLAADVLASSAAFAAAHAVLGECRAVRGDLDGAVADYDQAIELCERGSEFEVYLLILKCCALMAKADYAAALAVFRQVVQLKPAALPQLGVLCLPPIDREATPDQRRLLDRVEAPQARMLIGYQYHMFAKRFHRPEHGANLMRGPLEQLTQRLGPQIVPEEVRRGLPSLNLRA